MSEFYPVLFMLLGAVCTTLGFVLGRCIDIVLPRKSRGLVCDDELLVKGTDSLIVAAVLPKLQTLGPGREIVIRNEDGIIGFPEVRETK